MSAEETEAWTETVGITGRPADALRDVYDSLEELLEDYRAAADIGDHPGVGDRTTPKIHSYVEDEHPDVRRERDENDEGVCTEFTTNHDLDAEDLDPEAFYWAFVCPRCEHPNPLKGDPDDFRNRPFACTTCRWVSLLEGDRVAEFRAEHYPEDEA